MSARDEPVPLRDALESVGRELGLPAPESLDGLLRAWPGIVGDMLASHARVRSVRDGECVVEVDGSAWATQVRYLADEVVRRANEVCGTGVVERVRVVVAGPAKGR